MIRNFVSESFEVLVTEKKKGEGREGFFLIFQSYRMGSNKGENNTFTRFQLGQKWN